MTLRRPEQRFPYEYRRNGQLNKDGWLSNLGRGITEYSTTMALGALIGAIVGGFVYGAASADQLLNPQLIEALRDQTYWYQYLTSRHAVTPVILDNPELTFGISTTIGGAVGGIGRLFK